LAVKVFLRSQNGTAKQDNIFLAATTNREEKIIPWLFFPILQGKSMFSWLFSYTAKKKVGFLGSLT
jgi:hypothetical protein